jgi:predicted ArsR family transcriptional regulator
MEFARRRVAPIEQHYDEIVSGEPELEPSQALARALTQGGYAASVRQGPVGEQLCQQHCPVSHVAHEFPQLCEAETEVISKVLGRHVQRLATIAHGDGVCTTCIPSITRTSAPRPSQASTQAHERLSS